MTTGTKHRDTGEYFQEHYTVWPQGWTTNTNVVLVGPRYDKTWTGGDRPKQKREYEYFTYVRPSFLRRRRRYNKKLRTYVTTYERVPEKIFKKRSLIRPLENIKRIDDPHPYQATITEWISRPIVGYRIYHAPNDYTIETGAKDGNIGSGFSAPLDSWDSNDDLKLIGKLRERIAGSDFNLAVFLGEGREALAMIANSALRIRKALTAVRRFDLPGAMKALATTRPPQKWMNRNSKDAVANNWLELQYGWLPLLKDAEGGAQFLAKYLEFPYVQRYRARSKKPHHLIPTTTSPAYDYDDRCSQTTYAQIIAYVEEVDPVGLSGLLDPATLAWELLPYSFVVDWFLPIGDFLSARGLSSSIKATYVKTVTFKERSRYNWVGSVNGLWTTSVNTDIPYVYRQTQMTRTVSTSLDIPLPRVKSLKEAYSWKRTANAVALLAQLR